MHHEAAACCAEAADSSDERLNLLVDFFRQWEERLASFLESLGAIDQKAILDTWVQFAPTDGVDDAISSLRRAQRHGPGALVERCFELQGEIVTLLKQLADSLHAPKLRQLLLALVEFEEEAARNLAFAELTQREA